MLPDGSGLEFLSELRRAPHDKSNVPILLLTGLATPDDVVRGLSGGGDDYLAKPYDFGVLLARIESLLRRAGQIPKTLVKGALKLDIITNRAFLDGSDMLLSPKEFALLLLYGSKRKPGPFRRVSQRNHLEAAVSRGQQRGQDRGKPPAQDIRRRLFH